jgi:hypothetical protein
MRRLQILELSFLDEHEKTINSNVWKSVKLSDLPKDVKLLSTTWAIKKKENSKLRARITARGFL